MNEFIDKFNMIKDIILLTERIKISINDICALNGSSCGKLPHCVCGFLTRSVEMNPKKSQCPTRDIFFQSKHKE